jgi:hypothetical protein
MDGQTDFPRVVGIKEVTITLGRTEKLCGGLKRDAGIGQRASAEIRLPKGEAPLNERWHKGMGAMA